MDPSSQQSRIQCETCHKFYANPLSFRVHSKNCRRCSICKKLFSGIRRRVGAPMNFQMHEDFCIRRALTNPPAMGPALNNPPAMCGESQLSTLPGSSGNHGDAGSEKTNYIDPLGQQEADDGLNTALNSQVDLQSSASIQSPFVQQHGSGVESMMKSSTGFSISPLGVSSLDRMIMVPSAHISGDIVHTEDWLPDTQALGCSGNHVEQHTSIGLPAQLNLSGPQFNKKQQLQQLQQSQQPEQQTKHHMLSPVHNVEIARDLQLGEQDSPMEHFSTMFNFLFEQSPDSIPSRKLPNPKRQRPGVQDMVGSSSQLSILPKGLTPSETMLPVPSLQNEDRFDGGVPQIQASVGNGSHVEERLENVGMAHINQVDFSSSVSMPLLLIQQPSSGVQDMAASSSQSNIFPQGLMPPEGMLPAGLRVPSPPQSDHQNISGGGNEVSPFQASADSENHVKETLGNVGMAQVNQVNLDSSVSVPLPQMQPSSGAQDTAASSSQSNVLSEGLMNSDRMLLEEILAGLQVPSPSQSDQEDTFGGGNEMPHFQASADSRNYVEATLEKTGVRHINQADIGSSISMPLPQMQPSLGVQDMAASLSPFSTFPEDHTPSELVVPDIRRMSLIQPPSSRVPDKMVAFNPFPPGIRPLDRMFPVPYQHFLENTWGAGDDSCANQALGDSGNTTEAIQEEANMQQVNQPDFPSSHNMLVGVIPGNSSEVPHITESGAVLSGRQRKQGEGDNNDDITSTGDAWVWSDSLWTWS